MSDLITEIETFCAARDMSETTFGVLATKDKNLVPDIRSGRDLRMSTVGKIRSFMLTYTPEQDAAA